uniref:Phosphagen kinase C-terminal domain-containing protein n=1 Tax=Megaselia scalaris TaxID=36166 RepID=T1GFR8_MEGSC
MEMVERTIVEKVLAIHFSESIGEDEPGVYFTMNEVIDDSSKVRSMLTENHLMIELLDHTDKNQEAECIALNGTIYPYGRGVFVSENKDLAIWVNVLDHFRLIVTSNRKTPANLGDSYTKAGRAMHYLEEKLNFKESYFLGYLSSRPSFLGTGLKISTVIYVPNLMKEMENLRHLCSVRGLNMVPNSFDNTIQAVNMQSLGAPIAHNFEYRIFKTEQGKYLASTLGEPLIKGLTEVAEKRPPNPIAYLAQYLGKLDSSNVNDVDEDTTPQAKLPESATSHNELKRLRPSPTTSDHFNDDVVENDNDEEANSPESTPKPEDRDEHGQSMLHFACARAHAKGALLNLIEESKIDITYRDELYRTARDVSLQASQPTNALEIDQFILGLAASGEVSHFDNLQLNGYDHILDVMDEDNNDLIEHVKIRNHEELF